MCSVRWQRSRVIFFPHHLQNVRLKGTRSQRPSTTTTTTTTRMIRLLLYISFSCSVVQRRRRVLNPAPFATEVSTLFVPDLAIQDVVDFTVGFSSSILSSWLRILFYPFPPPLTLRQWMYTQPNHVGDRTSVIVGVVVRSFVAHTESANLILGHEVSSSDYRLPIPCTGTDIIRRRVRKKNFLLFFFFIQPLYLYLYFFHFVFFFYLFS